MSTLPNSGFDYTYNDNEAVKTFTDFYIENLTTIAEAAKFIPLNEEQLADTESRLEGISG